MINRVQAHAETTNNDRFGPNVAKRESSEQLRQRLPVIRSFASQHPVVVVAIGLAAGLSFGWWVKRK